MTDKPNVFVVNVARASSFDLPDVRRLFVLEIERALKHAGPDDDIMVYLVKMDANGKPINNLRIEMANDPPT